MQTDSETFGLKLSNIPLINLRTEFKIYLNLFQEKEFKDKFRGPVEPIQTPYMTWYGMPEDLLTIILQRVILGVESYLPGAVYIELGMLGKLNKGILPYLRNPYKFGCRSVVENYYHKLPQLIHERCSLQKYRLDLWDKTKAFYKEVRNPLFHGKQIHGENIAGVKRAFLHLMLIYEWIDTWHNPDPNKLFEK